MTDNKLDKGKLEKLLPKIRKMTLQNAKKFYPELKEKLLECGVILCGMPKLQNASLNGATKKFQNGSVLLLITDRNKSSDIGCRHRVRPRNYRQKVRIRNARTEAAGSAK